jgi:chorismate mutase
VKDVIDQLKKENKIIYKSIAERMKTAFDVKSARARRSRMTSVRSIQEKVLDLAIDLVDENHSNNSVIEIATIDYSMIGAYKAKKYTNKGKLLVCLQIIVLVIETSYEIWVIGVHEVHLALRIVSALLLSGSIYKYSNAFRSTWWRAGLLVVQFIVILSLNSEMFYLTKPNYTK